MEKQAREDLFPQSLSWMDTVSHPYIPVHLHLYTHHNIFPETIRVFSRQHSGANRGEVAGQQGKHGPVTIVSNPESEFSSMLQGELIQLSWTPISLLCAF